MKTVVLNVAGPHQSQAVAVFSVGKQWEGLAMHTALGLGSRAQEEEVRAVVHAGRRPGTSRPSVGRSHQVNYR